MNKQILDVDHFQFHIEEFKKLKDEIASQVKEVRYLEKLASTGSFAIYAWLLTKGLNCQSTLLLISWFLPLLFSVLLAFRSKCLLNSMLLIGSYIKEIENCFAQGRYSRENDKTENILTGWEHFLFKARKYSKNRSILASGKLFWGSLVLVNTAIPILAIFMK